MPKAIKKENADWPLLSLTTLAAQIANGTQPADVDVLLPRIVEGIDDYSELLQGRRPRNEAYHMQKAFINRKDKKWVIPNPVNPEDNFADSWTDETAQMFFRCKGRFCGHHTCRRKKVSRWAE